MTSAVHPGDALSRAQLVLFTIVLGALVGLGPFTIDMYLPAFPVLTKDFGVSDAAIQLTLTGTTVGFGLGQLFVGPLSDRFGRRIPLLAATTLHVLACVGAALAQDVTTLALFRVLQGVGAAGGGVVAMAMIRDLFGGRPLVRMLSRLALVTSLAPILAPVIGSQLLRTLDWRGLFIVLACYGLVMVVIASLTLPETMQRRDPDEVRGGFRARYGALFRDRIFLGILLVGGMQVSGLFAYLSSSSFLLQNVYGLSAQQFGLLFGMNAIGIMLGNQTASRLTRIVGPQWILAGTTAVQLLSAGFIVFGVIAGLGLPGVVVPLFLFILACGFGFPCVQVLALAHHGKEAGTAASMLGAFNFGLAGLLSPIVGLLGIATAIPMGAVMGATAALGMLSLWVVVRPRSVPALSD